MKSCKKEIIVNRLKGIKALLIALAEVESGIKDIEYSMDMLAEQIEEIIFEVEE